MSLAMSNLSLRIILTASSVLVVQRLKFSNFGAEVGDLFAKHFQVVHNHQDSIPLGSQVITSVECAKQL